MWTCPECDQKFINKGQVHSCGERTVEDFLAGKSSHTVELFHYFIKEYKAIGDFVLHPAKSRIAFVAQIRFGYIHRLGKDFVDVVLQFNQPYYDNFCFHKIAGGPDSYNHYFRLYSKDDLTDEVKEYMRKALEAGKRDK